MPLQTAVDPRLLVVEAVHRLRLYCATPEKHWHRRIFVRCPFHDEKTPSLTINLDHAIYRCFGCGKSGTVAQMYWDLTERSLYKDLGFVNDEFSRFAVEHRYSAEVENLDILDKEINIEILGQTIPLKESPLAMRYLRKRGIPLEVAEAMGMSFAPSVKIRGGPEEYFTPFINRLLIPIYEGSRLISIEGRDVTETSDKKVLYAAGTTVATLFDLEKLDPNEPLYVVEGLMDLAILRADPFFKNSTSIFGASLSRRQIHLLKRFKKIVLIPDSDTAGMKVISKLKEQLGVPFQILEIPAIPGIKDVGDIAKKLHKTVEYFRKRKWLDTIKWSNDRRYSEAFGFGKVQTNVTPWEGEPEDEGN